MSIRHFPVTGAFLATLVSVVGCATPRVLAPVRIQPPIEQSRCKVAASQSSPLVTEWPASEKANLEALLREGGVAVSYSGCHMRVLPRCRVRGSYVWQRTTPASDYLEISDEDQLYAKLPLGAVSLEGELRRSGSLSVHTVVAGLLRLASPEAAGLPDEGECAQATHLVEALSIGAYSLSTGSGASVGAGVGVASLGQAGGSVGGGERLMRASGDTQVCGASTDGAPHPNCRSPIQVFLRPLPGRGAEEGPPGTVQVDFVSANANGRWDIYIDDEVACSTPCTRWVNPSRPVFLRARDDSFGYAVSDRIQVLDLAEHAEAGALQLQAHPTSRGKLVTGFTFSGLGGMALLTGITLSAVSCPTNRPEMCQASLISLGAGSLVTAGAIWLILDSGPRAKILPTFRASLGRDSSMLVRVGPGFIEGRF